MRRQDKVTVGWRVLHKTIEEGQEVIRPASRIYHAKEATQEFYVQALRNGMDCWIAEIVGPERKELEVK